MITVAVYVLTTIFPSQAQESPFELSWPRETALLTTGLIGYGVGQYRVANIAPPQPSDLQRNDLAPWDRFVAGRYDVNSATASTVLTVGVTGAMLYLDTWEKARGRATWTPFLEDGLILSEALAWSGALNLNVRAFRIYPRPLAFGTAAPVSVRTAPDASGSFYSGHASAAFLGAAYLATVYPLRHPDFQYAGWLWAGSQAAASTVAVLRVTSGKHFPSDVAAGAAVGTLLGWGFARIHQKSSRWKFWSLQARPQPGGFAFQADRAMAAW